MWCQTSTKCDVWWLPPLAESQADGANNALLPPRRRRDESGVGASTATDVASDTNRNSNRRALENHISVPKVCLINFSSARKLPGRSPKRKTFGRLHHSQIRDITLGIRIASSEEKDVCVPPPLADSPRNEPTTGRSKRRVGANVAANVGLITHQSKQSYDGTDVLPVQVRTESPFPRFLIREATPAVPIFDENDVWPPPPLAESPANGATDGPLAPAAADVVVVGVSAAANVASDTNRCDCLRFDENCVVAGVPPRDPFPLAFSPSFAKACGLERY